MRSFSDFSFKTKYSKIDSDIANDFFIPCMENSVKYDRITGFFGSSVFVIIWGALKQFIQNNGKIRLLCSPKISDEDRSAINAGLDAKNYPILINSMKREIQSFLNNPLMQLPSKVLSYLIATDIIEMRLVTTDIENIPLSHKTMFHDKVGLFYDNYGHIISFGGSMNETYMGLSSDGNSETISVNESWDIGRDGLRTNEYRSMFEDIWSGNVQRIKIHKLPSEIKQLFKDHVADANLPELLSEIQISGYKKRYSIGNKDLFDHQKKAFDKWVENNRHGIYKHATGSGKTLSGLYALQDSLKRQEVPVIIVPSIDLQRQWVSEIEAIFGNNVKYLLCGGEEKASVWKKHLYSWTCHGDGEKIVIAVINTAASNDFISTICQGEHIFVLIDEVHRAGSPEFRSVFNIKSGPRLGLSATPERYRDEDGTQSIINYFDRIVDEFTLEDAINLGVLTEYYYYPHEISLTANEEEQWKKLSKQILYAISKYNGSNPFSDENILKKIIKRSKIVKNASNKIDAAVQIIRDNYKTSQKWIVYCDDRSQLNKLKNALDNYGFDVLVYYSNMVGDRKETMNYFTNNGGILLSIKCLDEGINVPATTHALIIASSQNPREFIQRRGRVLRKADGKSYSYIHDILIVPSQFDNTNFQTVIGSEISRAIKFGDASINHNSCIAHLQMIAIDNDLDLETLSNDGYESDSLE